MHFTTVSRRRKCVPTFVETSFPVGCLGVQGTSGCWGGAPSASPGSADVLCALNKGVWTLGLGSPICTERGRTELLALVSPNLETSLANTHPTYPWIQPWLLRMVLNTTLFPEGRWPSGDSLPEPPSPESRHPLLGVLPISRSHESGARPSSHRPLSQQARSQSPRKSVC